MRKEMSMKFQNSLDCLPCKKISPAKLFLTLLILFEGIALIRIITTHGEALGDLLFYDRLDTMMDFFHPVLGYRTVSPDNLYTDAVVMYPPLSMLLFYWIYRVLPEDVVLPCGPREARMEQSVFFVALVLLVLLSILIAFLLADLRKGSSVQKRICALCAIFSYPMLFQLERGNIILLAFFFTLLFAHWMDSESRIKRELALIALGIAFGLKGYPAVFGLVLISQKRWKESIRCAIYGIAAFVIPALCFRGVNLFEILRAIGGVSDTVAVEGFGYKVNFSNTIRYFMSSMDMEAMSSTVLNLLCLGLGALCLIAALVPGEMWKKLCLISIFIAGVPGVSYVYVMIFFLIPAFFFLNENDGQTKHGWLSYVYAILLAACLVPLPFSEVPYITDLRYPMTLTVKTEGWAIMLLAVILIIDRVIACVRIWKNHRNAKSLAVSDVPLTND